MKAVKGKDGRLTFISRESAAMFNNIDMARFLDISTLTERENYIAEELYKQDILQKITRDDTIGYQIYPQQQKI